MNDIGNFHRASADDIKALAAFSPATLHEAMGQRGAMPCCIKPIYPGMKVAGSALTVRCKPGDNLAIHRALYAAKPGDVLVVATRGGIEWGYWGEILNEAAMALGLGGLVIDGGVRDTHVLAEQSFPVFSNGVCIRGTLKGIAPYALGRPIAIGDVVIRPGDLVVGDRDGVLVLPPEAVDLAVEKGRQREADEAEKIAKLRAGARTLELYGLGEG